VTAAISPLGSAAGLNSLRVIVGKWADVKDSITARQIQNGPSAGGVFAHFTPAGALTLLDGFGHSARVAPPGTGLLAATETEGEGPSWLVTGQDDAGVERAAAALAPDKLRNAFAVAATPRGIVRLPVGGF
jgi:hypothetical protein